MDKIKIVTLMEDNLCEKGLVAEHGLSVYVETSKHKLLIDTGQSDKTWNNARQKGIDLKSIDTVILSHGHYDHSGGLMTFASLNPDALIYLRSNVGGDYYSCKEDEEKYIGINKDILKLPNMQLVSENIKIDEELSLFTGVKPNRLWSKGNRLLHEKIGEEYVQDTFSHEQYLAIQYDKNKYALISGCAHNGILNILDTFRKLYGTDPAIVISGFHMIQQKYTDEDLQGIRSVAEELVTMDTVFYTGHCTGTVAFEILKEVMGEKLKNMNTLIKK